MVSISKDFADQVPQELVLNYKSWDIANLPWDASQINFKRVADQSKTDVLERLSSEIQNASEVCIATDVDPSGEGELLAWEALEYVGWTGRTTRMYHADEEVKSVQKAFAERKVLPEMAKDSDYARAWVRNRWDWLSMQWTRAATGIAQKAGIGNNFLLREGRLKSVIVDLVAKQQEAYESYQKVPFYEARFKSDTGVWFVQDSEVAVRVARKEDLKIPAPSFSSITVDSRTTKRQAPPKLPDLTDLAAKLAPKGIAPKQVLETYQKMYEDQVVSYPRTEDKFVSPEQFSEMLNLTGKIAQVLGVDASLLTHTEARPTHIKSGGAHGANRPGSNVPSSLNELAKYGVGAQEIYRELALAWLAILAEDRVYEHVEGHLDAHPSFKGSCDVTVSHGWKMLLVDSDDEEDEEKGPDAQGLGETTQACIYEGKNKRPQRPTVKWLKSKLEKYDVGTAATRTSTIADVSDGSQTAHLKESKGVLSLTDTGLISATLLDGCLIADPSVTEKLHQDMRKCGAFEIEDTEILGNVAQMLKRDMALMEDNVANVRALVKLGKLSCAPNEMLCPRCGMPLKSNKTETVYNCSSRKVKKQGDRFVEVNPGCGFRLGTTIYGQKRMTLAQVKSILAGNAVHIKGLVSKAGKTYGVVVTLDKDAEWGVHIDFANDKKVGQKKQNMLRYRK